MAQVSMDQIKANACKRNNQRQNNETTLFRNIAIEYYISGEFWFTMVFVLRNVKWAWAIVPLVGGVTHAARCKAQPPRALKAVQCLSYKVWAGVLVPKTYIFTCASRVEMVPNIQFQWVMYCWSHRSGNRRAWRTKTWGRGPACWASDGHFNSSEAYKC